MSEAAEGGRSFVSAHHDQARALGHRLADLTDERHTCERRTCERRTCERRTCERRLVGATLATIPSVSRPPVAPSRVPAPAGASQQAFGLVRLLMGDAEVMVQTVLSWAIREWTRVHPEAAASLLHDETSLAAAHVDGARAWVIGDSLAPQPAELRDTLRPRLSGIRRHRDAPSSSIAAARAARFAAELNGGNEAVAHQGDRHTRSRA